ncbi:MAG TPA: hypothetical protein ENN69_05585, partial [Spirochaetia bacterium]|nr:hypothetical protein [Spirochaetia bacterium]
MKKQFTCILLLAITLLPGGPSALWAEGAAEQGSVTTRPRTEIEDSVRTKGVVIIPEHFLRGYDPITVFYRDVVGPERGGPLDNPGDLLSLSPPHEGEYRFLDAHTVQFLPATNWPALKQFTVKVRGSQSVLRTLMVPPTDTTPGDGARDLDPIERIILVFPNELSPADIERMISFEVKPLPGVGRMESVILTGNDFTVKMLDKTDAGRSNRYVLTFSAPIEFGKRVTMRIRLSLDDDIPGSLVTYDFRTKQEFRLAAVGSGSTRLPVATNGSVYSLEQAID